MNDYDIKAATIARRIDDAKQMRAEALRERLNGWDDKVRRLTSSLGRFARTLSQRGRWNLSLPAPHH